MHRTSQIALMVIGCAAAACDLAATAAQEVRRDVPYATPPLERQVLDIYSPANAKNLPVVFWIHGGGWRRGDKAGVGRKPQALVNRGMLLVSTNYRFLPNVTLQQMTGDIARSIRWVHEHEGKTRAGLRFLDTSVKTHRIIDQYVRRSLLPGA